MMEDGKRKGENGGNRRRERRFIFALKRSDPGRKEIEEALVSALYI